MSDVTRILDQIEEGDPSAANKLLPLVYDKLRHLASQRLAKEQPGQTLQATALVHEAYLRLVDTDRSKQWDGRGHFFAAAAEAMRRIVVDSARRRQSLRRGGEFKRQDFDGLNFAPSEDLEKILSINEVLAKLETDNKQAARIVKLRYFAGFTVSETAEILSISTSRANQIWAYAKSWLLAELGDDFL